MQAETQKYFNYPKPLLIKHHTYHTCILILLKEDYLFDYQDLCAHHIL
jgi:hypothetical protein